MDADLSEPLRTAMVAVGRAYNVKGVTPLLCRMIDVVMGEVAAGAGRVYLADLFGASIPSEAAAVLKLALDKMIAAGDVTEKNRWQALEYLAAEYLAS